MTLRAGYEPIPTTTSATTTPASRPVPHQHRLSSGEDRTRSRIVTWVVVSVMLLTLPTLLEHYQNDWSRIEPAVSNNGVEQSPSFSYNSNNENEIGDMRSWARDEENEDEGEEGKDRKQQHSHNNEKNAQNKQVKELFYHHQKLDHFRDDNYHNSDDDNLYWSNRYYQTTQYWKGPGYPIFVILGGEGATDDGFFYPFVTDHLAKHFGAAVLQIEHRFYGPYVPLVNATTSQLLQYMTVPQALADTVRLTQHVRTTDFHCSPLRTSPHYCPVITVGGSYPGALSALLRIVYPEFIDVAYAASAPLLMYAQSPQVDPNVYYDIVTRAADTASPGCAAAVRQTLDGMQDTILPAASLEMAAQAVHVCAESIPDYIVNRTMLADALVQIASFKFADDDMDAYPPGNQTALYKTCQIFQTSDQPWRDFLFSLLPSSSDEDDNNETDESTSPLPACFDLRSQIPKDGTTLDDTDGDYHDGRMWDWQTCTDLIFVMGFSSDSMFPPKPASYAETTRHCRERFGVTPRPYQLVEQWRFDDLTQYSYILFTNGLQDLWSGGSITSNVSDTVLALNFPNGAHHSDLSHVGPSPTRDSPDVQAGFLQIQTILGMWLDELKQVRT